MSLLELIWLFNGASAAPVPMLEYDDGQFAQLWQRFVTTRMA